MRKLGPIARIVGATLRDTANPTMLKAGYKANVIPSTAEAVVDCRFLPGREEAFEREVDELLGPDVTREWVTHLPSVRRRSTATWSTRWTPRCGATTRTRAPRRTCFPAARTPSRSPRWACAASASRRCGCRRIWTSPSLFHGIDERVPVDALTFGTRVLDEFLQNC